MGKRLISWILYIVSAILLLLAMVGCGEKEAKKELWQILEEAQYDRYKPKLDYVVEKYGDMFEMDVYGQITCTNPEYKDWDISGDSGSDNFAIRLRRDDLEGYIHEVVEPVLGECKVYITDGTSSTLDMDAEIEEFFTYDQALIWCRIYVPFTEDYEAQWRTLMRALIKRECNIAVLDIVYVDREQYEQFDRSDINMANGPQNYEICLDAHFYNEYGLYGFKWRLPEED